MDDESFYAACLQISALIKKAPVTPLFISLCGQMLTRVSDQDYRVPESIPELVLNYVATTNAAGDKPIDDVLSWAQTASWVCLQPDYIPSSGLWRRDLRAGMTATEPAITDDVITYLLRVGFLVEPQVGKCRVSQDPLAEYLSALFFMEKVKEFEASLPADADSPLSPLCNALAKLTAITDAGATNAPSGFVRALLDVAKTFEMQHFREKLDAQFRKWGEWLSSTS